MEDIRKKLNISIVSPYWDEAYRKALNSPAVPEWLAERYLRELHRDCNVLPNMLESFISAVPYVTKNIELRLLAKTLYNIIGLCENPNEAFEAFELPVAPKGEENTIGYDCVAAFPVFAHIRSTWAKLCEIGIDEDILKASFFWADDFFNGKSREAGRPLFDKGCFMLYNVFVYIKQLVIGRLRFEVHENSNRPARVFMNNSGVVRILMDSAVIHRSGYILGSGSYTDEDGSYPADFRETEGFYEGYAVDCETHLAQSFRTKLAKSEWKPVFSPGDAVIKVHIPSGSKLDKEACDLSFKRAREVFSRCYPEIDFKGFVICCWMLSPELRDILKPDSNIIHFQNRFNVFPSVNNALDVYLYVYHMNVGSIDEVDFEKLPEDNSLMRGVKKKGLEGKYVQQLNGFIPF